MRLLLAVFFLTTMNYVFADMTPPVRHDPLWLIEVRTSISSGNFEKAIQQLQNANQNNLAEWNSLMGFSLRQQSQPDLVGAENYYKTALRLDPKHRGALEYYGMLKLIQNDLAGAEELLVRLDIICFFGCEEYSDLKNAIKEYRSKK